MRVEPMSRMKARATSTTTSALPNREVPVTLPAVPSFRASLGAMRGAHGHFAVSAPASRHQQTRQVGASDQKDEGGCCEQNEVTLPRIVDATLQERLCGKFVSLAESRI